MILHTKVRRQFTSHGKHVLTILRTNGREKIFDENIFSRLNHRKICVFFLFFWVYDEIADNFSHTRHKPWPQVVEFLRSFPSSSLIFDVGCGNGKYLNSREDLLMVRRERKSELFWFVWIFRFTSRKQIGADRSQSLLNICRQRNFQVFLSDCLKIPVRNDFFDGIICIAVIHHLSTEVRREEIVSTKSFRRIFLLRNEEFRR